MNPQGLHQGEVSAGAEAPRGEPGETPAHLCQDEDANRQTAPARRKPGVAGQGEEQGSCPGSIGVSGEEPALPAKGYGSDDVTRLLSGLRRPSLRVLPGFHLTLCPKVL